jgi:hypothetical protein
MKHIKSTQVAKAVALVFASGLCATASATVVSGVSLGAQEVVNQFNSMNHGQGLLFSFERVAGHNEIFRIYNANRNYEFVDLSGYKYGTGIAGDWYFTTAAAALNTTVNDGSMGKGTGTGKLNYSYSYQYGQYVTQTAYRTSAWEASLSVGAAYMYAAYVTQGQYGDVFAFDNSKNTAVYGAWCILTYNDRLMQEGFGVADWNKEKNNPYLQSLLSINNDINYWLAPYDPDKLYTEIGYYSVFTMNNWDSNGKIMRNMLFVADMTPTAIPEPETYAMMLAGLGLMGAVVRRRKGQ